jgi:hypothetical protein
MFGLARNVDGASTYAGGSGNTTQHIDFSLEIKCLYLRTMRSPGAPLQTRALGHLRP